MTIKISRAVSRDLDYTHNAHALAKQAKIVSAYVELGRY